MRRCVIVVAAVLVAVLAGGCDAVLGGDRVSEDERQELLEKLRQRPDIEQVTEDYRRLNTDIREMLSDEFGITGWGFGKQEELSQSGCAIEGIDHSEAKRRGVNAGHSDTPISEEDWPRAFERVKEIAATRGFTDLKVHSDQPNNHVFDLYDANGAYLNFVAMEHTAFGFSSSCHLTPEAHSGRPSPSSATPSSSIPDGRHG